MKKLFSRKKLNNNGTTMVEVLVAFLILMIIIGSLSQVIKFAGNMVYKTTDIIKMQEDFNAEMYKKTASKEVISTDSFTLSVNTEKTAPENSPREAKIILKDAVLEKYTNSSSDMVLYKFNVKGN